MQVEPISLILLRVDKNLLTQLSIYLREDVLTQAALECTRQVVEINEGHYTAWYGGDMKVGKRSLTVSDDLQVLSSADSVCTGDGLAR